MHMTQRAVIGRDHQMMCVLTHGMFEDKMTPTGKFAAHPVEVL
jgi:hypothetical protein